MKINRENRFKILFRDLVIVGIIYFSSVQIFTSVNFINAMTVAFDCMVIATVILLIEHLFYLHKLNKSKINQFE